MSVSGLPKFVEGGPISASAFEEMRRTLAQLENLKVGGGLQLSKGPTGYYLTGQATDVPLTRVGIALSSIQPYRFGSVYCYDTPGSSAHILGTVVNFNSSAVIQLQYKDPVSGNTILTGAIAPNINAADLSTVLNAALNPYAITATVGYGGPTLDVYNFFIFYNTVIGMPQFVFDGVVQDNTNDDLGLTIRQDCVVYGSGAESLVGLNINGPMITAGSRVILSQIYGQWFITSGGAQTIMFTVESGSGFQNMYKGKTAGYFINAQFQQSLAGGDYSGAWVSDWETGCNSYAINSSLTQELVIGTTYLAFWIYDNYVINGTKDKIR